MARLAAAAMALAFTAIATPTAAQDPAQEAAYAMEQCRNGRGDLGSCVDHGRDLYTGTGLAQDQPEALRLWRMVCERDRTVIGGQACSNAAIALRSSEVIPRDLARAYTFADRACTLGYATGCLNAGFMRRDGEGTEPDGAKALFAFERACGHGDPLGCAEAGWIYLDGELAAQDYAKAAGFHRQACDGDISAACASLGVSAQLGRGMAVDAELAVRLYKRACARGVNSSCGNIEAIRGNGEGALGYAELMAYETVERAFPPELPLEQRYLLARAAFDDGRTELAIAGFEMLRLEGFGEAAFNLGQIYYNGQGVPVDRRRAISYLTRASEAGHPYAKYLLGQMYWHAIDVDWNPDWGVAMMRSAAEAGLAEADPIWRAWQAERNAYFEARDAANRQMAIESERSQAAADAANMARIWGLYSSSQNRQENGQVCGTIYRNNQANYECMARETFDRYYKPNR